MRRSHERERWLRRNQTDAERRLWFRLRNYGLPGFKFRRQHRIGPYIVDFVCVDGGLVVEIDGGGHLHKTRSDEVRSALLYAQGFRVLRF